eukprot:6199286-Pleurochrysis_carterae.AAC.2
MGTQAAALVTHARTTRAYAWRFAQHASPAPRTRRSACPTHLPSACHEGDTSGCGVRAYAAQSRGHAAQHVPPPSTRRISLFHAQPLNCGLGGGTGRVNATRAH